MNRYRRLLVGVPARLSVIALVLVWALLFTGGHAWAQMSTASLTGVVHDPSGAVIPNANLILRNVDTTVEHTSASNNTGAYASTISFPENTPLRHRPGLHSTEILGVRPRG